MKILGVNFEDTVERTEGSFASSLFTQLHKLFDWLDDEEISSNIAKLTETPVSSIPNPYAEWAKLVLKKFSEMPNGNKIINFLKMLVERNQFIVNRYGYSRGAYPPNWKPFLGDAKKKLGVNPAELEEILRLTVRVPNWREYLGGEVSTYWRTQIYLVHSEYHLDLIRSEEHRELSYGGRYDHFYRLRHKHKSTIKKLLREMF